MFLAYSGIDSVLKPEFWIGFRIESMSLPRPAEGDFFEGVNKTKF